MNDYFQPDFYRFNEDSLKLVEWILTRTESAEKILDIGAGSGVLGIELANKLSPKLLTLLELQNDFKPYLEQNIKSQLHVTTKTNIVISSFGEWKADAEYDLAVFNPPYFLPGHGEKNTDERKEKARSFSIDGWKTFMEKLPSISAGKIFFVIRNEKKIFEEFQRYLGDFQMHYRESGKLIFVELF